MPGELLCDVVGHRDQTCAARRRWYVLPLSIAVHGALAAAILIVPLAANVELPTPPALSRLIHVISVAPVPRAPDAGSPPTTVTRQPPTVVSPDAAPITAPSGFRPEAAREVVPGAIPSPFVESGFGSVLGIPGPVDRRVEPPEPPPSVRPAPVPVGGKIRPPQKIAGAAPIYPLVAQQARLEGVVVLEAMIDEHGAVERLRVVRSAPLFDQAALDAVRRWRYTPTLLNSVPVPVLMTVTVQFTLRQ
jgi:protein TonB